MLKLSLFEDVQKHTVFVSIPLNANELLLPAQSFNGLCPFASHRPALKISLLAFYVQTRVRQWWSDPRSDNM